MDEMRKCEECGKHVARNAGYIDVRVASAIPKAPQRIIRLHSNGGGCLGKYRLTHPFQAALR
jgi:hypothetical protein